MQHPRLADFIRSNIEPILQAWEDFARSIEPPALTMSDAELRDHARFMLLAFAADLDIAQTDDEREVKSKGLGPRESKRSAAVQHAESRLQSGYSVVQLVSEYRALRSSVLSLWGDDPRARLNTDMADMTRFNEAVDQAVAESICRYEQLVKQSQNLFLAILGHDLQNPLGALVAGTSYMRQAADVPQKYILMASRMLHSAQRMSKLIGDLIDFTRTHLGPGIPVQTAPSNVVVVCGQVVNELRTCHPGRPLELHTPLKINADIDADRIAQVLSNLVGNALQYGDAKSPVRVSVASSDDAFTISVNSKGPPIPSERLKGIFDPMVRVTTAKNAEGAERTSLGLGLYISREIVHAHGGHITVDSNVENGTTFDVTIPRQA